MSRNLVRMLRLWLAPAALWMASAASAHAQNVFDGWGGADCGSCSVSMGCQTHHCPPPLSHCQERPPIIRVKCGCPRPICNPCNQPGWGYYETCWSPWPWPPNYSHCLTMPPAATIALNGPTNPNSPFYGPGGQGGPGTQAPPIRNTPVAPNMPPYAAPPVQTTPVMPQMAPRTNNPLPQTIQPMPGGGIDALPVPRQDAPPRPLPNPGGAY